MKKTEIIKRAIDSLKNENIEEKQIFLFDHSYMSYIEIREMFLKCQNICKKDLGNNYRIIFKNKEEIVKGFLQKKKFIFWVYCHKVYNKTSFLPNNNRANFEEVDTLIGIISKYNRQIKWEKDCLLQKKIRENWENEQKRISKRLKFKSMKK